MAPVWRSLAVGACSAAVLAFPGMAAAQAPAPGPDLTPAQRAAPGPSAAPAPPGSAASPAPVPANDLPAPASASGPAPPVPLQPPAPPNRFELSGDTWMASGAYDNAVNAYERGYELAPTPALARKLAGAHALASRELILLRPMPPPPPVAAEAPPAAHTETPKPKTHWYGYQVIISDGATFVLFVGLTKVGAISLVTAIPYLLAPPIIHLIHGRIPAAGADFGLRLGAPVGGALVGAGLGAVLGAAASGSASGNADFTPPWVEGALVGGVLGFGAGIVSAMVIDAAVFAREPINPPQSTLQWVPTVTPIRGGASAGVGGVF